METESPHRRHIGPADVPTGATWAHPGCARLFPVSQVYFVIGISSRLMKIGYASDAWKRLSSMQTGCPEELRMLGVIDTYLPRELERDLHERFKDQRVRGEWFRVTGELVDYAIEHGRRDWEDAA